jgi:hypothetical protein
MKGKAMKSKSARLSIPGALAAAAALIFAAGCPNSDPITGPRRATPVSATRTPTLPPGVPTPTPPPAGNIAGSWTGTYSPEDGTQCDGPSVTATFEQIGSVVRGSLTSISEQHLCFWSPASIRGVLQGDKLTGTVSGGARSAGAITKVSGTLLSEKTLILTIAHSRDFYSGGQVRLQR